MFVVANSRNGRHYLIVNEIQKKNLKLKGKIIGFLKVPQSIYAKRIIIIDEAMKEYEKDIKKKEAARRHIDLKIKNLQRDLKIMKGIEEKIKVILCQHGTSSAKESESDSSKRKPKPKKHSSSTSK